VILLRDVLRLISRSQLAPHCQKFFDDPISLTTPYMIQLNVSPDSFTYFMKNFPSIGLRLSPETFDHLMLLAQEFGYNNLIAGLARQRDLPRREENIHDLL
jgi:hypothetical protein